MGNYFKNYIQFFEANFYLKINKNKLMTFFATLVLRFYLTKQVLKQDLILMLLITESRFSLSNESDTQP